MRIGVLTAVNFTMGEILIYFEMNPALLPHREQNKHHEGSLAEVSSPRLRTKF
jgi:hypothetical protein